MRPGSGTSLCAGRELGDIAVTLALALVLQPYVVLLFSTHTPTLVLCVLALTPPLSASLFSASTSTPSPLPQTISRTSFSLLVFSLPTLFVNPRTALLVSSQDLSSPRQQVPRQPHPSHKYVARQRKCPNRLTIIVSAQRVTNSTRIIH